MAGGTNAKLVMCMQCGTKASRYYEDAKKDLYKCEQDHQLALDWNPSDPPSSPQWPAPLEVRRLFNLTQDGFPSKPGAQLQAGYTKADLPLAQ